MLSPLSLARRIGLSLVVLVVLVATSGLAGAADRVHHKVRRGETLYRIAKQYGVTVRQLAAANKMKVSSKLRVGRRLIVPVDPAEIAEAEPATVTAPPEPEAPLELPAMLTPVKGPIISPFHSPRGERAHKGIDIKAPDGTPIRAAADGIVRMASERFGAYGRLVVIEHAGGVATYYAHNQKNLVAPGQEVRAGEVIGLVGRSGNASCDHLHFEVRMKGAAINPERTFAAASLSGSHRDALVAGGQP